MEKILKIFNGIIKGIDEKNSTVDVIVSTDSVDRDMEKINISAFKKRIASYKANPVLLSSHKYDMLQKCIGKAETIQSTKEGLRVKFKYFVGEGNQEADWGFFLAKQGIAAFSIGFMGYGYKDLSREEAEKAGYWREYTEIELLEVSQVLIPSNRDAVLGRSAEAEGIEKELCEMAIKSIDFDKVTIQPEKKEVLIDETVKANKDRIEQLEEQIKSLEKVDEALAKLEKLIDEVQDIKDNFEKNVIDILVQEKHYSNSLFGDAVDSDLKQSPTSDDILNAVKEGFKKQ